MAQGGGEVDRARPTQHPNDQVAQGRHDVRAGAGADLAGVLGEGDFAEVVQRLDAQCPRMRSARRAGLALACGMLVTA